MEKLENQMSNVKEAYKVVFGPEGSKPTNMVLKTLRNEDRWPKPSLLESYSKDGTQFITAGDFPFSLETFQKLEQ